MRELFSRATNHADQRLADSALRPRPIPPLHSFSFFAGGFFLKLYGAETGRGLLHYTIIVVYNVRVRYTWGYAKRVRKARQEPEKDSYRERHNPRRYCENTRRKPKFCEQYRKRQDKPYACDYCKIGESGRGFSGRTFEIICKKKQKQE